MARIKIELPNTFSFQTSVKIRVTDINYGGHVGNDNILSIMHEGRLQYLKHLGFKSEIDIAQNIGLIVSDAALQYKAESFHGDEIDLKIATADFNKYGFDMLYLLNNSESGKEIARGKTGIVYYNYVMKKVAPVPQELLQKLK